MATQAHWQRGYVQVYTGNGKGKTTAALGLTLRAVGAGLRVFFGQFIKARQCSEVVVLEERFSDLVTVRRYGRGGFIGPVPDPEDVAAARAGLAEAHAVLGGETYSVVVLDEINTAAALGLLTEADLLALIAAKPPAVELVLTGRGALPAVIARADLVTEMQEVKHYYQRGVRARLGIEK